MDLSTETYPLDELFGYAEAVEELKKIGFDCYDFSMFSMHKEGDPLNGPDYMQTVRSVRRAADKAGIRCNQSHAPFPPFRENDEWWNSNIFGWLVRALEITSELGGGVCIVHPHHHWTAQQNAERVFRPLEPYCKKYGVKIAVENMFSIDRQTGCAIPCACSTAESFSEHLSLLDPEWFVACLDIGHAEILGDGVSASQLILALGDRLQALHVHDNDRVRDLHVMPYLGQIDWESVYDALKRIGYRGELTFESDGFVRKFPQELRRQATGLLYETGRYMIGRLTKTHIG